MPECPNSHYTPGPPFRGRPQRGFGRAPTPLWKTSMTPNRRSFVSLALASALLLPGLAVADTTILVPSSRDGRDACNAAAEAAGEAVSCQRHLTKAMAVASETINAGGAMTVTIKMAAGDYTGDMDGGSYALPLFSNPEANLIFEGGYDASFSTRDPWGSPTRFATTAARGAAYWTVARNTKTRSLVVDGVVWDMAASNEYDAKSNSLKKGGSSTHKFIKFNYWELGQLTFRNNVFMNAPHRVTETLVRAADGNTTLVYENNVFLNNVIPVKLDSARFRNKPSKIIVRKNSFLLNWSYNPDPTTGNPGALDVGSRDAAEEIVIEENLFYANFGGGIQIAPDNAPKVSIKNNNFVGNGLLHGNSSAEAAAIISVRNAGMQPLNGLDYIEDITDMTKGDGTGNVSVNPAVGISMATSTQTANSASVSATDSWENSVRSILGMNLDGGTVAIKDYAPKQSWNPSALFPKNQAASKYGASRSIAK